VRGDELGEHRQPAADAVLLNQDRQFAPLLVEIGNLLAETKEALVGLRGVTQRDAIAGGSARAGQGDLEPQVVLDRRAPPHRIGDRTGISRERAGERHPDVVGRDRVHRLQIVPGDRRVLDRESAGRRRVFGDLGISDPRSQKAADRKGRPERSFRFRLVRDPQRRGSAGRRRDRQRETPHPVRAVRRALGDGG